MKLIFELGGDFVFVKIEGKKVSFANSLTNFQQFVPIKFLKLNQEGILKEFPDLKGLPEKEMKQKAVERFLNHIKTLGGEEEVRKYIEKEFTNMGYTLKSIQKEGFREKRF